jgi:hypothetical protein
MRLERARGVETRYVEHVGEHLLRADAGQDGRFECPLRKLLDHGWVLHQLGARAAA